MISIRVTSHNDTRFNKLEKFVVKVGGKLDNSRGKWQYLNLTTY